MGKLVEIKYLKYLILRNLMKIKAFHIYTCIYMYTYI